MRPRTPSPPVPPRRASRLARLAVAGLAVAVMAGCVKNFPNPFDRSGGQADSVQLYVDNQNFNDVRLWKIGLDGRTNLGTVTGRSQRTIQVPWRQTADIRFQIEPLAGRSYQTNMITAAPGDRLQLYIRENPGNTYLTRR